MEEYVFLLTWLQNKSKQRIKEMKESMSGHINNRRAGENCRVAVNKLGCDPDILSHLTNISHLISSFLFLFLKHEICHLFLELFNNPIITSWM